MMESRPVTEINGDKKPKEDSGSGRGMREGYSGVGGNFQG